VCVWRLVFAISTLFDAPSWGTPCDIKAIYTSLKSTFSGLQFCRWHYGSIFIRLAVIASETQKMSRNSKRIWPYSSSRSSKVIALGVNGKPICDFLLVINCNFSRICYRFRDVHGVNQALSSSLSLPLTGLWDMTLINAYQLNWLMNIISTSGIFSQVFTACHQHRQNKNPKNITRVIWKMLIKHTESRSRMDKIGYKYWSESGLHRELSTPKSNILSFVTSK